MLAIVFASVEKTLLFSISIGSRYITRRRLVGRDHERPHYMGSTALGLHLDGIAAALSTLTECDPSLVRRLAR